VATKRLSRSRPRPSRNAARKGAAAAFRRPVGTLAAALGAAIWLAGGAARAGSESAAPAPQAAPRIEFSDKTPEGQRPDLRRLLLHAHENIAPLSFQPAVAPPIRVQWAATGREFQARLGLPPEHTMAAAVPRRREIVINGEAFNAADPAERQMTMTHEFVHLFLGLFCPEPLPLWLEEGLAMRLSGDVDYASEWRLTLANSLGSLAPLMNLRSSFPGEASARAMAYREGYSATGYYLSKEYPATGARGLVEDLVDPDLGPRRIERLQSAAFTQSLEVGWRASLKSIWAWVGLVTSGTALWGAITALFLAAYIKRRRDRRRRLEEWESEDVSASRPAPRSRRGL